MSFFNGHLERRVSHRKRDELLPVLGAREPARGFQALVERGCGQGRQQAENGQTRRPSSDLRQCALGHAGSVVVHTEDK